MAVEVLVCRYGGGEPRPGDCEDCGAELKVAVGLMMWLVWVIVQ